MDLRSQLAIDNQMFQRRSIRLKDYDYSQEGAYFVTICTQNKASIFGTVKNGKTILNKYGQVVAECWRWLTKQYPYVELDKWVLMPNHMHGIVIICRGGSRTAPTKNYKPLGRLIGAFKTTSSKRINILHRTPGARIWQRNYYEHVIRNETDLNDIRQYILDNPVKWDIDENNPDRQMNELKTRGEPVCQTR